MHDLLIVLRPFSVYERGRGRRDLRPGTTITMEPELAERFVKSGHLQRSAPASPPRIPASMPWRTRPRREADEEDEWPSIQTRSRRSRT